MNDILTETRIKKLKEFNWQEIFSVALALDSFNGEQFRFLKGLFIEKSVSLHSNENLIYVGLLVPRFCSLLLPRLFDAISVCYLL